MIGISRQRFADLVFQAYHQLPPAVQQALDNVDVLVHEQPTAEELDLLEEEGTLFGLYTGVPRTEREGIGPSLPDQIVIYRRPILQSCSTTEQVVEEVRVTLWHEVGHYLGMTEEHLHQLGYG